MGICNQVTVLSLYCANSRSWNRYAAVQL